MASKQQAKATEAKQQQSERDEAHEQEGASKAIAADAQSDIDLTQEIDESMKMLDGNLSEMPMEEALSRIDEWYNFLHKVKEPAVKEIVSGIKELQKMVKGGKASGHEIGAILERLGEQTNEYASEVDKELKNPLQKLGKQLSHAGASVSKAEDQEHLERIDSMTQMLENDELSAVEPAKAVEMIDPWFNLLNKSDNEQFKELANSLKELKQAVKKSNPKSATIAEILSRLGEQVGEVAAEAPRGFKGHIQKLGKQLNKAAKSIGSAE